MEKIIQQIAESFVKETMAYYAKNGISGIGKMADDVLAMAKEAAGASFGKSALTAAGGAVSRQTAWRASRRFSYTGTGRSG